MAVETEDAADDNVEDVEVRVEDDLVCDAEGRYINTFFFLAPPNSSTTLQPSWSPVATVAMEWPFE